MLSGVIFDLDGTLVDSRLDFRAIRSELGIRDNEPILETIEKVACPLERQRMNSVLDHYELAGAECATPMPGVVELLTELQQQRLPVAVLTRNSVRAAKHTLERLGLAIELVIAREDAPPKPNPSGLRLIQRQWSVPASRLVFVGDYLFDLQAGSNAGITTVLYAPEAPDFPHNAKWILPHFSGFWAICDEIFGSPVPFNDR